MNNQLHPHISDSLAALINMEQEIDRNTKNLLELSITHETTIAQNKLMRRFITCQLDLFESMFESNDDFCCRDKMREYVTIARYMQSVFGRKHIADRVEEKAKELPF